MSECAHAEYQEEHAEAAVKPARQEKVKMGFQLYRPPTILAQASSEVLAADVASVTAILARRAVITTVQSALLNCWAEYGASPRYQGLSAILSSGECGQSPAWNQIQMPP